MSSILVVAWHTLEKQKTSKDISKGTGLFKEKEEEKWG